MNTRIIYSLAPQYGFLTGATGVMTRCALPRANRRRIYLLVEVDSSATIYHIQGHVELRLKGSPVSKLPLSVGNAFPSTPDWEPDFSAFVSMSSAVAGSLPAVANSILVTGALGNAFCLPTYCEVDCDEALVVLTRNEFDGGGGLYFSLVVGSEVQE